VWWIESWMRAMAAQATDQACTQCAREAVEEAEALLAPA
jgi:hypothetical protein